MPFWRLIAPSPRERAITAETEMPRPNRKRAGNRGRKRRPCEREGCTRNSRNDHLSCSFLCSVVVQELARAQRICEATGDTEHWLSVVTLNDALTAYYASDSRLYSAAFEVGLTDERWQAIKHGKPGRTPHGGYPSLGPLGSVGNASARSDAE